MLKWTLMTLLSVMSCAAGAGCTADALILGRDDHAYETPGATRRLIQVDAKTVECWVARSPGASQREPESFLLYFVGRGDRAEHFIAASARDAGERPIEVWGMNYPGAGGSDGPPSLAQTGKNALAVFDAMQRVAGDRPIFVKGVSLGTITCLYVVARRPVAGALIKKPVPLRPLLLRYYGWWNLWLLALPMAAQVPAELDAVANAARCKAPALFIWSDEDEIVPARCSRRVFDAYGGPKRAVHMLGRHYHDVLTPENTRHLAEGQQWMLQLTKGRIEIFNP